MKIIKTKSFELAVNAQGDENSSKMVILLPGQLDTKDYAHMVSHVDFFAKKGYFALSFDPPGTWDSPGSIDLYTMTNYKKAINELIEFYGNKPTVLMGHSRGGSMAMFVGTSNEHVTHIIAVMSSSLPTKVDEKYFTDGIKISYRDMPPNDREHKKRFDLPYGFFLDAKTHNIIEGLRESKKPKLFFYGTKDVLIPPERIKATFQASAEPKMIYELQTEHDYRLNADIVAEVNEVTEKFLENFC